MIIIYIFLFIVSIYILVKGGTLAVKKLVAISRYLKISEYILAFILMASATSLPELFVGINSALIKAPILSLGNIIGSNILNLSFVLGAVVIFAKGIKIKSKIAKKDSWIVFFISILPLLLLIDKKLSRTDGFILLIVFIWYLWHILKSKKAFRKKMDDVPSTIQNFKYFIKNLLIFLLAVILLLIGSWGTVRIASLMAQEIGLPLVLISLILVAIGTSLPELVFGIKAVSSGHEGMNLGNIIGSTIVNSTFILATTAIICPIAIESFNLILISGFFMIFATLIVNFFIATKEKISLKEGVFLVLFYVVFLITGFLFK